MANYLFYDLFQNIKKFMDNHFSMWKEKQNQIFLLKKKSLSKLVYFNMVFILQYLQNFFKDESCFSENYNKFNIHTNNIYHMN